MKGIYAVAFVSVLSVAAVGCKPKSEPAPEPAAPVVEAAPVAPTPEPAAVLEVSQTASIAVPAAKVWAKVKNFSGLNGWHPAVAKDEIVEGKDNEVGAVRLLTLAGETPATIKEKLLAYDDAGMTFSYSIVEGVLPVSDYTSIFVVKADGDKASTVTWSGSFKRKDTGAAPAENANDKAATDTITGVYTSGLDNLKKVLETK